ncbi:MAG: precorrin-4 C(11)-methyltransferase [Chloroflexota bacterium]|nr:precorrin-4 C(11)-methyltransferase [Chloroflexota bacterium]
MSGAGTPSGKSGAAGEVAFVGAGPGAPGLLTLDAVEALRAADLVLYADSLVSPEIARFLRPGVPFEGTKDRHLDAIAARMIAVARDGLRVARVHSGDPALYGAITEQIALLRRAGIPYRIIPGVSSVFAAAAALGVELTVPDVAQTIIMTRAAGRTGMPEGEALGALAAHGTTLAILLGITRIRQLVADLVAGGYPPDTPAAALYRVSWPDEAVVRGRLADLAERVKAAGWSRQALILVGRAIDPALQDGAHRSHLYAATYTHRYRRAEGRESGGERREVEGAKGTAVDGGAGGTTGAAGSPVAGGRAVVPAGAGGSLALVALTKGGTALGARLAAALGGTLHAPERFATAGATPYEGPVADLVRALWARHGRLVLVMPVGVAVRAIAPLLADKRADPGVVALDEAGRYAVSLAGGHLGGANALARAVARVAGGVAVVTTASDVQGLPALDLLGREEGWAVANPGALTRAAAALVNGERVAAFQEAGSRAWLSHPEAAALDHVARVDDLADPAVAAALVITHRRIEALPQGVRDNEATVVYHPPCLSVGIGCSRGVPEGAIAAVVEGVLVEHGLAPAAVRDLASIDVKGDEAGLVAYAARLARPLRLFGAAALDGMTVPNPSPAVLAAVGTRGVAEPAALLAAGARALLIEKQVRGQVTVAVALREETDD